MKNAAYEKKMKQGDRRRNVKLSVARREMTKG